MLQLLLSSYHGGLQAGRGGLERVELHGGQVDPPGRFVWSVVFSPTVWQAVQAGGRCGGADRADCRAGNCSPGLPCCREGGACNLLTPAGWRVCWCRTGTWQHCSI